MSQSDAIFDLKINVGHCNDLGSENSNLYGSPSETEDFITSTI